MMLTSFPVNYPEMVVEKSEGLTVSEKKLAALGYRTLMLPLQSMKIWSNHLRPSSQRQNNMLPTKSKKTILQNSIPKLLKLKAQSASCCPGHLLK